MNRDERVKAWAKRLWEEAGRPTRSMDDYLDRASELVAIEENSGLTRRPLRGDEVGSPEEDAVISSNHSGPTGEPVEPIEAVANTGEFPTLTDQGEGEQVPHWPMQKAPARQS
jgi:hypothetical protein